MSQPIVIVPTVGRVVWFNQMTPDVFPGSDGTCAAIVTYVHSVRLVNLCVFDANGHPHPRTSVQLVQPGDEVPTTMHCLWMPFQVQQSAKYAAAA